MNFLGFFITGDLIWKLCLSQFFLELSIVQITQRYPMTNEDYLDKSDFQHTNNLRGNEKRTTSSLRSMAQNQKIRRSNPRKYSILYHIFYKLCESGSEKKLRKKKLRFQFFK